MEYSMETKKYFHLISQDEVDELILLQKTVGYVKANYVRPDWCNDENALDMKFGCWSLCDLNENGSRTKVSKEYCSNCDSCNKFK